MNVELNHLEQPIGQAVTDWTPPSLPARQVMDGRHCRLEPLDVASHAKSLFTANQLDEQGRNWTYLPYGPFSSFEDLCQWMEESCLGDDPLFFAIRDRRTEDVVGLASYLRITPQSGSIEVGHLQFSRKLQRTVAATEAMYLMMRRAFELGYRRYEWKCHSLNAPSRAAAQRLGLSFEGVFRKHTIVKGRNRDTAWYAAIDEEWPALQQGFEMWLAAENFDESGQQKTRLSELTAPILNQQG